MLRSRGRGARLVVKPSFHVLTPSSKASKRVGLPATSCSVWVVAVLALMWLLPLERFLKELHRGGLLLSSAAT
jgi:hypothetical protein